MPAKPRTPGVTFIAYGPVPGPTVLKAVLAQAAPHQVTFFVGNTEVAKLVSSEKSRLATIGNSNRSNRKPAGGRWRLDPTRQGDG